MTEYTANLTDVPVLLKNFWELLEASGPCFRQERLFRRAVALTYAELFTFGRHTVTQLIRTLGEVDHDWSAWYRLLGWERFPEEALGGVLLRETLTAVAEEMPYVVTLDGVLIQRSGRKVGGSAWWRGQDTAPFDRGLRRAQRFVEVACLTPIENGMSRAIPLRWMPAPTEKAVASVEKPLKEWEAGLKQAAWVRGELDRAGREMQRLLVMGDGSYDVQGIWNQRPERTDLVIRCARNRVLYSLPSGERTGRGRPKLYGERQAPLSEFLKKRSGQRTHFITVRGHARKLRYRVEGPFLVRGAPDQPLFLIAVRGETYPHHGRTKHRDPVFYLVSALKEHAGWRLPYPAETLLEWSWHRWECEVAHREMKSALGVGEKQCWAATTAHSAVQWGVWVYGQCVLGAYRTWGLLQGPKREGGWYRRAKRWSFSSMWQGYREAFWELADFRPLYVPTLSKWLEIETWLTGKANAERDPSRI